MIKSMTGYGQGAVTGETFKVTIDLRSVNNRNLDIHWRAPMELASLEIPLKKQVQAAVTRGRVDVNIGFTQTADVEYEINRPLVRGYLEALRTMREEFGFTGEAALDTIARLPNVLQPMNKVSSSPELIESALKLRSEHSFSFYDSLIIASTIQAKCQVLYSEDMQHMQRVGNLQIVNPFLMVANEPLSLRAG